MTKRRQKDRTHIHRLLAMSREPNEKSIRVPINALRAETLSHWRTTDDDSGDGLDNLEEHSTAHEKKTHKRSTLTDIVSWGFLEKRSRLVYQNFCTHSEKKRRWWCWEAKRQRRHCRSERDKRGDALCWSGRGKGRKKETHEIIEIIKLTDGLLVRIAWYYFPYNIFPLVSSARETEKFR